MFRHRRALISTSVVLVFLATSQAQSNSRSYDTNDWIPVPRPCPTCAQNEDTETQGTQKRPTGRVLNLPASDQKRYFAPEQTGPNPQSYSVPLKQHEETQVVQQQAGLLQNQAQFQQQHIILPPQLQSLINQGQPLLSPQRINSQLQSPSVLAFQPTLQTVPQFALNDTAFHSRDVVQNINLGLYNQQVPKQPQQINQAQNSKHSAKGEHEEVQLLYVPLENLRERGQRQQLVFPSEQQLPTSQAYHQPIAQQFQSAPHKQAQLKTIQQDFIQQALQAQKLQEQFQHNVSPVPQANFRRPFVPDPITHEPTTTPAPRKRKPHQPPLAVYMGTEGHSDEIKLDDVLTLLKDAKTISVQDNIGPNAPQVFVGPSHLQSPEGYVKFDLPYLSAIESNRVERKVDQLPFFVAPLSYKAPPGYSKIPFPAPHVGSVIINHLQTTTPEQTTTENIQQFLNRNLQETSSHISYSPGEVTTVRTRGRQRQPSRTKYVASTVQTPVSTEIPYGPLPTKVPLSTAQHSVQESSISQNPYGPTQFVQSTTPSIFENPALLPEQIFSTKNRFSTPTSNYNVPESRSQYVQRQQELLPTEHTPAATTLPGIISDDKYTVLEQFPLPGKISSNEYAPSNQAHSIPQRIPTRQHSRGRPTDNYYNDESKLETPLPLISNIQSSNEQYLVEAPVNTQLSQKQRDIVQQYTAQEDSTKQIALDQQSELPPIQDAPMRNYSPAQSHETKTLSTEPTSTAYEEPARQFRPHARVRGKQHFTPEPYYRNQYETHNVRENVTRHEPVTHEQVTQHQTPAHETREQEVPLNSPGTRSRGKPQHMPETYFKEDYVSQDINDAPVHHGGVLHQQVAHKSAEYDAPSQSSQQQASPHVTRAHEYEAREVPVQQVNAHITRDRDSDSREVPQQQVHSHVTGGRDYDAHAVPQLHEGPHVTRGREYEIHEGPQQTVSPHATSGVEYDSREVSQQQVYSLAPRGRDHESHAHPLQQLNSPFTRGTGNPQFNQELYSTEHHGIKSTEPQAYVTKEPVVNYEIPIISTQKSLELPARPQYVPETYYREQPRIPEQHPAQYSLPAQLPPISPHLPGLVNSLQDQAIRPLLAPLLLPPSEQTPVTEYTAEYFTTPFTTTTTTSTSTTTPMPIVETTTQFKRTRSRQRGTRPTTSYDYVNTTPSSRRNPSYRGRRPYTGRARQQSQEENVPVSSTAQPVVETETATRTAFNRNRYAQRDRQYVSSTTEQPRRQPSNSRQRFRTRGRPLKTEEEYATRSTTETIPNFQQPILESGFVASIPVVHQNTEIPIIIPTNSPNFHVHSDQVLIQKQPEQALVYVENNSKQQQQQHTAENHPIQIGSDEYVSRERFIAATDVAEPSRDTTISVSAPENNIVSDKLHNEPVILHRTNQQPSKYSNTEYDSNENGNVHIPHTKYIEEPEVRIQPTTESVRIRSRIRNRPRTRGHQARYQTPSSTTTTTTTQRATTESKEEEEEEPEEFFGFFRPPSFVKPIKMEYKPSSELRSIGNPTPTVAYLHRATDEEEQGVYVSPVNSAIYSTPATHQHISQIDDNQADRNIRTQYISSTPNVLTQQHPSVQSSEEEQEEVIDIKPITRRPISSFNRLRRPTAPAKTEEHADSVSRVTDKYYTVRTTKRPETQPQRITRIRGRIRKPTRATTVAPTSETVPSYSNNNQQQQQQQHYSRTNELSNTQPDQYIAPVKTRQRITNRGKSHFQLPRHEKIALEPESDNYPPSFLQAQHSHQQKVGAAVNIPGISAQKSVNILSVPEVHTSKPSFQLTIEPEEGDEEYADQVPYSSVNKHRIDVNLDEGAESKYSAKIVEKPYNYNFIVSDAKGTSISDKVTEKITDTSSTDLTTAGSEPAVTTEAADEVPVTVQSLTTTVFPDLETTQSPETTTTDTLTTVETETDRPQGRRRGVWRLVKLRPVVGDVFESAESQNIGTILDNSYFGGEKSVRKYHAVKRVRTTTEETQEETTTTAQPQVVTNQQNTIPTVESDIFAPLYEMFGYTREGSVLEQTDDSIVTTTEVPNTDNVDDTSETTTSTNYNTTELVQDFSSVKEHNLQLYPHNVEDSVNGEQESTTEDSWRNRIIGTSTTTEISHETEICYRGRCVKSSAEEISERL